MNIEIPPFYLGQEVVANQNHSQGIFKKGDEFIISRILKCGGDWAVEIGVRHCPDFDDECYHCGMSSSAWHFLASLFSPKITISAFVSMKEVAQLETVSAN
jgi:hypothetical protein